MVIPTSVLAQTAREWARPPVGSTPAHSHRHLLANLNTITGPPTQQKVQTVLNQINELLEKERPKIDRISDQVILLRRGYVVAEGQMQGVRSEGKDQPMQILVRCNRPHDLAARLFREDHLVEAKISGDGNNLLLRTKDADGFYLLLNRVIVDSGLEVESVAPADDDVNSVYQYLIGGEGGNV